MATKEFYALGDFRYGTRMLRAGDGPFPMDAPTARIFAALGKISPDKPKAAKAAPADEEASAVPAMTMQNTGSAKKKPATKRTTRRKK